MAIVMVTEHPTEADLAKGPEITLASPSLTDEAVAREQLLLLAKDLRAAIVAISRRTDAPRGLLEATQWSKATAQITRLETVITVPVEEEGSIVVRFDRTTQCPARAHVHVVGCNLLLEYMTFHGTLDGEVPTYTKWVVVWRNAMNA
ncbi:hypothetical protein HGA91_05395 [candidate division WWE3 bacterium]|nr:hypothetical protein [candidate division WWE3 bacterium]